MQGTKYKYSKIKELTLENVRCFRSKQPFKIKPLTFLVGENSSGKTTALGCIESLLLKLISRPHDIGERMDFNRPPYQMGSFRDIVTNNTSKKNKDFKIGCTIGDGDNNLGLVTTLAEEEKSKTTEVQNIALKFPNKTNVIFDKSLNRINGNPYSSNQANIKFNISNEVKSFSVPLEQFGLLKQISKSNPMPKNIIDQFDDDAKKYYEFLNKNIPLLDALKFPNFPQSIAPIRSKPRRTYDILQEYFDPEGSDVPSVLMKLITSSKEKWKELKEKLKQFGKRAELFEDIDIKTFGDSSPNNPFRLLVSAGGCESNIVDVGYGVGQILPILVRLLSLPDHHFEQLFLIQQPEVHLHPKAQASLCSLFVDTCKKGHNLIIETHSDYMIKRARIEIKTRKISHDDVSLIYLEPTKDLGTKVHNISFDPEANVLNAPESYDEFFISEINKVLGL